MHHGSIEESTTQQIGHVDCKCLQRGSDTGMQLKPMERAGQMLSDPLQPLDQGISFF